MVLESLQGGMLGRTVSQCCSKREHKKWGFPPFSCRIFHYKPSSHCRKPSIWVLIYSHIAYSFQSWEESPPTKLRRRVATSWGPDSHPSDGFCPMTSNDYTRRCPRQLSWSITLIKIVIDISYIEVVHWFTGLTNTAILGAPIFTTHFFTSDPGSISETKRPKRASAWAAPQRECPRWYSGSDGRAPFCGSDRWMVDGVWGETADIFKAHGGGPWGRVFELKW